MPRKTLSGVLSAKAAAEIDRSATLADPIASAATAVVTLS
jgi:hypothetical protein